MTFRRKNNRLSPASYEGGIYFLTLNCRDKAGRFAEARWARWCEDELVCRVTEAGADLLAYVVMPDHMHALISQYNGTLGTLMKKFKQVTGFHFKRETGLELWQKSYYDHVVRKEEDLADIALYIAANPVRRGLVDDWEAYDFTGGSLLGRSEAPPPTPGDLKVAATFGEALR